MGYCLWNLRPGDDPTFKHALGIYCWAVMIPTSLWNLAALRLHTVREDGTGCYDQLAAMPVTPGALAKLNDLDKTVGKSLSPRPLVIFGLFYSLCWYFDVFAVHWAVHVVGSLLNASSSIWSPLVNSLTQAPAIICADQLQQCTKQLEAIDAAQGWDVHTTMLHVRRVCRVVVPLCERQADVLFIRFGIFLGGAALFFYGIFMGHLGSNYAIKLFFILFAVVLIVISFRMFHGVLAVTARAVELVEACSDLRVRMTTEREEIGSWRTCAVDQLVTYVHEMNGGQGPGFTALGVVITPKLVWGACVTLLSTAAALALSVMEV